MAYRPGHRGHLYYRLVAHRGRKRERRSLSEADYAALLSAAHQQLHAPIILIWDNLNTHLSKRMQKFAAAHTDWLTVVVRLPAYAPELNATEGGLLSACPRLQRRAVFARSVTICRDLAEGGRRGLGVTPAGYRHAAAYWPCRGS